MDRIQQLTRLNVEIEGLLHVLSNRDNEDLRRMLSEKFNQFSHLFTELMADGELDSATADAEEAVLKEAAETLTEDEVKDQAESAEVEDENDAATEAIEREEDVASADNSSTELDDKYEYDDEIIPVELGDFPDTDEDNDSHHTEHEQDDKDADQSSEPVEDSVHHPEQQDQDDASAPAVEHQTIGDRLSEEMPAEIRVDEMIARKTAGDLSKAFTLNDKLRFRRTLFAADADTFVNTLEKLSTLDTYSQAVTYLTSTFDWNPSDTEVSEFLSIIRPHYPKED